MIIPWSYCVARSVSLFRKKSKITGIPAYPESFPVKSLCGTMILPGFGRTGAGLKNERMTIFYGSFSNMITLPEFTSAI